MTKKITKSNVIPFRPAADATSNAALLVLADQKAKEAWQAAGTRRVRLAQDALAISPDCAEAYLALATDVTDWTGRVKLYRQALAAAERVLGSDWERQYKGRFVTAPKTLPLLRSMIFLANGLRWEDELDEAVEIYNKILKLSPGDEMGVRYELAPSLFEAKRYKELEKLLALHSEDPGAILIYTLALYQFAQEGATLKATETLRKAFERNPHVPMYLPGVLQLPNEKPDKFRAGEENEAICYGWDNGFLWFDTEGASKWLADVLETELYAKFASEKDLVDDVIKELRSQTENSA